jgi:hypothetical protein
MFRSFALICLVLVLARPASAGQAEAREAARMNNCPPKKIEILQNFLGSEGKTVYQVTCNLPKTTGSESASGPDAVLIGCDQSLCELMRPVAADKK